MSDPHDVECVLRSPKMTQVFERKYNFTNTIFKSRNFGRGGSELLKVSVRDKHGTMG